jgi:hypothetical protein
MPARPSSRPQEVQLKTDVNANMSVGIDDPKSPKEMIVDVELQVELKLPNTDKSLLSYVSKHSSLLKVLAWSGFDDWSAIPQGALGPYFSMAYIVALDQAEHALLAMGFRGVSLPRSNKFEEYEDQRANGLAAIGSAKV